MNKDINKYYDTLNLMIPIRYQYIKKIIFKYQNKEIVNAFKSKKVLDLGCGTGEFLKIFYDMGANCIGIDSFKNFKVKNFKKIRFINEDIYTYLNKNKNYKFDYIFCFEVIEHLNDKDKFFKLVKKNLKRNGILFISTINKNWLSKKLIIDFAENFFGILPKKTHDYNLFFHTSKLKEACNKNKFKIIDLTGLVYNPLLKNFNFVNSDLVNYISTIEN
tara:strand:- start:1537 stop:2190 length:654 start_codon:yes stop_codon:yes gene_type:complete